MFNFVISGIILNALALNKWQHEIEKLDLGLACLILRICKSWKICVNKTNQQFLNDFFISYVMIKGLMQILQASLAHLPIHDYKMKKF